MYLTAGKKMRRKMEEETLATGMMMMMALVTTRYWYHFAYVCIQLSTISYSTVYISTKPSCELNFFV